MKEQIKTSEHINLCKKCSLCCKIIIPKYNRDELHKRALNNDEEAKLFFNFFKKYKDIDSAWKVAPEYIEYILESLKAKPYFDIKLLDVYSCSYITIDNICSIYEERPDFCKNFPYSGWETVPKHCGFQGRLFEARENRKKAIRKLKEKLHELKHNCNNAKIEDKQIEIEELKLEIEREISLLENHGSKSW